MEQQMYDIVIIGGGAGGLSAAIYAMRAALKTVLIEKGVPGGQMMLSEEVENYPGFTHVGGAELSLKMAEHARSYGVAEINDEVTAVEPGLDFHTVKLAGGQVLKTHAIILATGGTPRRLNAKGESENYGKGISYCAVCDGFFFRGKNVIVVGGGDSACEEGLYLAKLAEKVYIVHRRDALRASLILQQRVKADCKMEIIWNSVISEVNADDSGVTGVILQDTKTGKTKEMPIDGVFIFVGFTPNNQLVPAGVRMNSEGFAITDDKCATAIPGIYAIGDLREKYARQIVLSAADGCMAALAAAHYVESRKATPETCELPGDLKPA